MLNLSLTPDGKILSKDADSYPFMYRNYPFLRSWVEPKYANPEEINGLYRKNFTVPKGWKDKHVFLSFDGVLRWKIWV